MKTISVSNNILQLLDKRITALEKRVTRTANDKSPTLPIYNADDLANNLPVGVEGQWAIGTDNAMWFYKDALWNKFCTGSAV